MGTKLLEYTEMTLFYYPVDLEQSVTLLERGHILSPFRYEGERLILMKAEKRAQYDQLMYTYLGSDGTSHIDLVHKVARARHPPSIAGEKNKALERDLLSDEDLWINSVRLYGDVLTAEEHVQRPPRGIILGLEREEKNQDVLLVPNFVNLSGAVKEVHMRVDLDLESQVLRALKNKNHTPIIRRIPL